MQTSSLIDQAGTKDCRTFMLVIVVLIWAYLKTRLKVKRFQSVFFDPDVYL